MPSRPWVVRACANWCWLWSLKLGLAFWSCALPARALSRRDLWPLTTPLHWPGGGPVQSLNEVRWHSLAVGEVCWLCGSGLAPPTQEVVCVVVVGVWWNVMLYYWHCLWTSSGRLKFLGERASCCCGRALAPPSFRFIGYIKCTLLALAAIPLQRTWLNESG